MLKLKKLQEKHPEFFKNEKEVFKLIQAIKDNPTHFYSGTNTTMITTRDNGKIKKMAIEKNMPKNEIIHATRSSRNSELNRLNKRQLEGSPTPSLHNVDTAHGAKTLSTTLDKDIITKPATKSQPIVLVQYIWYCTGDFI